MRKKISTQDDKQDESIIFSKEQYGYRKSENDERDKDADEMLASGESKEKKRRRKSIRRKWKKEEKEEKEEKEHEKEKEKDKELDEREKEEIDGGEGGQEGLLAEALDYLENDGFKQGVTGDSVSVSNLILLETSFSNLCVVLLT